MASMYYFECCLPVRFEFRARKKNGSRITSTVAERKKDYIEQKCDYISEKLQCKRVTSAQRKISHRNTQLHFARRSLKKIQHKNLIQFYRNPFSGLSYCSHLQMYRRFAVWMCMSMRPSSIYKI